jgi:hypothetical protein
MSDKPTQKPKSGSNVKTPEQYINPTHMNPGAAPPKVKLTSPQITHPKIPAKGPGCELQAFNKKQESKFNRGATTSWSRTRAEHKRVDKSDNNPMVVPDVPDAPGPKPAECASSYSGHKVAGLDHGNKEVTK